VVLFTIALERRDFPRAAAIVSELRSRWQQMPANHIVFAVLPMSEALLASGRGDHRTAVAQADRAVALAEVNSQALEYLPRYLISRAEVNLEARHPDEARADAERALAMERKVAGSEEASSRIGRADLTLSRAFRAQGRPEEAQAAGAAALRHLEPTLGADHPKTRAARSLAGAAPYAGFPPSRFLKAQARPTPSR
jgi:tetratricopeptide (TPR) repeat protein